MRVFLPTLDYGVSSIDDTRLSSLVGFVEMGPGRDWAGRSVFSGRGKFLGLFSGFCVNVGFGLSSIDDKRPAAMARWVGPGAGVGCLWQCA